MSLADTWGLIPYPGRPTDWPSSSQWPEVWLRPWRNVRIAVSRSLPGDMAKPSTISRFADFEVDVRARQIRKHGTKLKLHGQPFQMLLMLLEPAGEVVSREQMQEKLWPGDPFVDFEHSLNTAIKRLRQALNDSATEPRFIETLPRVGYRFIAPITASEESYGDTPAILLQTPSPVSGIPGTAPLTSSPRRTFPWFLGLAIAAVAVVGLAIGFNVGKARDRLSGIFRSSKNNAALSATAKKARRSVAVLPLQNLSADASQTYFADGMTDELTTDLAQFGNLRVISRTSAIHYKGASKTAPEIGRELGVDTLIEGTVQRVGNRVRIRVQLIDSASDRHLWARSYDRELRDVLLLQSLAAHDIAEEVQGKVAFPPADVRPLNPHPVEPEAYEAYLKGRYFWNKRTEDGLIKSIEYFQQAISRDPKFAAAYAGLADSYSILGSDVLPASVASSKAHVAANHALELGPGIAEGHAELALVEFY